MFVSECIYGGRVTDEKDFRLIKVIFESQFQAEAEEESFEITDVMVRIARLPDYDQPEIYGLHDYTNITFEKSLGRYL